MRDNYKLERMAAAEAHQRKRQLRNLAILAVSVAVGLGAVVYVAKDVARSLKPAPTAQGAPRSP